MHLMDFFENVGNGLYMDLRIWEVGYIKKVRYVKKIKGCQ